MSIFGRLYSGVLDTVYGFKLNRFRSQIEKKERDLHQLIMRKAETGKELDLTKIRHILIIKNEPVADMIMVTPLIRNLAVNGYKVDVLASESNQIILENNPYVHKMIVQTGGTSGSQKYVQEHMKGSHYDMVLDLRNPVYDDNLEELLFPQYISCDYLISWNRSNIGIYDVSLEIYEENGHFIDVIAAFLNYLKIETKDLSYDVPVALASKECGLHYVRNLWRKGGPIVVLYPFSTQPSHSLSEFQVGTLIDKILECYPFGQVILTGQPEQVNPIKVNALQEGHVHKYISPVIMDIVPLLEYADIVITPETFIMHIASAFQKPLVGLSTSLDGVALKSKEKAQHDYEYQKELVVSQFFDMPKIKNTIRPEHYLLNEHLFMPVNDKSELFFSNTADMTYLSIDGVVSAFQRLTMQYVHDAQYVSPMKALPYHQIKEEQKDVAKQESDQVQAPDNMEKEQNNEMPSRDKKEEEAEKGNAA